MCSFLVKDMMPVKRDGAKRTVVVNERHFPNTYIKTLTLIVNCGMIVQEVIWKRPESKLQVQILKW